MQARTPIVLTAALMLVAALLGLRAASIGEAQGQTQDVPFGWPPFYPAEFGLVHGVGFSPDWPADGYAIVTSGSGSAGTLARTVDGGATWEALGPMPDSADTFVVGPRTDSGRVVLGYSRYYGGSLARSADGGGTWQADFKSPSYSSDPVLAPEFAQDNLALLVANGQLHRSRDGGATWEQVDLDAGQRAESLAFSPDFAADRTIYLGVADVPLDDRPKPPQGVEPDPSRSLGVLHSTDGGATWPPLASQPSIDGAPYTEISLVKVSPTFAQDNALVAFGFGASTPSTSNDPPSPNAAIFISRDRGQSWTASLKNRGSARVDVAFSPNFATDGTMLYSETSYPLVALSPGSQSCSVEHSPDWGATWNHAYSGQNASCDGLFLGIHDGWQVGLVAAGGVRSGAHIVGSMSGGRTWSIFGLSPPGGLPYAAPDLIVSPGFAQDGTMYLVSSTGGL